MLEGDREGAVAAFVPGDAVDVRTPAVVTAEVDRMLTQRVLAVGAGVRLVEFDHESATVKCEDHFDLSGLDQSSLRIFP